MEEQLIEFKTAKLAKEKGFNISVTHYWNTSKTPYTSKGLEYMSEDAYTKSNWNNGQGSYPTNAEEVSCSAPTQGLLQKWLRDEHKISIRIDDFRVNGKIRYDVSVQSLGSQDENPSDVYETYEQSLEEGLYQALQLIK